MPKYQRKDRRTNLDIRTQYQVSASRLFFIYIVIPFLNKRLSLTKNRLVVAQFIARLTRGCPVAFQNLYNATLFFRFGIRWINYVSIIPLKQLKNKEKQKIQSVVGGVQSFWRAIF